jgi:putative inorganic carbon (hco3(-)) transporter
MSITTIIWVALYTSAILGAVFNPLMGALGYLLEYYMRPELKWWGRELPALRYNLIISVAFGVAYLVRRRSLKPMVPVKNVSLRWLLALAVVMVFVTGTVAVNSTVSWNWALHWFKMAFIFPVLLANVVRSRTAFNVIAVAHMAGAGWWGWQAYDNPRRVSGRLLLVGSGDSLNDNEASAHLLTVLPFIVIYLLTEKDIRLRLVALLSAPFVVNTLILCNSRGAMVGLAAAMGLSFFLIRSGYRLRLVGAAIAVLLGGYTLADDTFITRQQTTSNYEEDGSAMERIETWKGAAALVADRPLGAGGRGFHLLSPIYIPNIVEAHGGDPRAPHNTYVMVVSEWGIAGLVCFIGLYASTIRTLDKIKRRHRDADDKYFYWRAFGLQLALFAYMVASVFCDRLYGEAGYWMVALSYALRRIQLTEEAEQQQRAPAATRSFPAPVPAPAWRVAVGRVR